MMSNVHIVMNGKMSKLRFPAIELNFLIIMEDCSLKPCKKSFRIWKWNVGVNNLLRVFHFSPVLQLNLFDFTQVQK